MPQSAVTYSVRNAWAGLVKMSRLPNLFMIAATYYMAAIFLVGHGQDVAFYLLHPRLFILVVSTLFIAAAGYHINDYYDVKIDYINKPEQVVVGRSVKRRVVMLMQVLLNGLGILAGFWLAWPIGLIHLLSAFMLWWYSNQLKRLPFIGNFTVALLTALPLVALSLLFQGHYLLLGAYAVFAGSVSLVREIIKDMEDLRGDASFGCKTLPIIWGIRGAKQFVYGLVALFAGIFFWFAKVLQNPVLTTYFIVLGLPLAYFIVRLVRADTKQHFHFLSIYIKLILLSGIISMVFFYQSSV